MTYNQAYLSGALLKAIEGAAKAATYGINGAKAFAQAARYGQGSLDVNKNPAGKVTTSKPVPMWYAAHPFKGQFTNYMWDRKMPVRSLHFNNYGQFQRKLDVLHRLYKTRNSNIGQDSIQIQ